MRRRHFVGGVLGAAGAVAFGSVGAARAAAGAWEQMAAPDGQPAAVLNAVAAGGQAAAWAVGEEARSGGTRGRPLALHWNGSSWSRTGVPAFPGSLRTVASGAPDAAWAVGYDTTGADHLLSFTGTDWRETTFPGRGEAGTELYGVATHGGEVWVSGRYSGGSCLLHFDGSSWRWTPPLPGGAAPALWSAYTARDGSAWVGGDAVARFDGSSWQPLPALPGLRPVATGVLPLSATDVWVTGHDYGIGGPPGKPPSVLLLHYDGSAWTKVATPFTVGSLSGIAAAADGQPAFISGWDFWDDTSAHYLRWEAGNWVTVRGPAAPSGKAAMMNGIARIPGTGDYLSVGTDASSPFPPAQLRIERYEA
ncbi:hypothetical protein [Streptomyces boninensis]|uniref:hypothetical protein n=1 Tax=Streptomyces boninensis TaxID=2039455 RepID=UPI003B222718